MLMANQNEGLTKTYSRFHARGENSADIARLRALHHEMDVAVLRAYGWDDLADRAAPEFIEQEADEGKTPKTRLDWPSDFKDEVLARLLALNATRAAQNAPPGWWLSRRSEKSSRARNANKLSSPCRSGFAPLVWTAALGLSNALNARGFAPRCFCPVDRFRAASA